ncbi:MAG: restriction endonuclease [bacterium]
MNNYTFSTLNDKEFEQIVRDLLNAQLNLKLQDFKIGRDGGVDLRYSTCQNDNSIIVQAKHYAGSRFPQLKNSCSNEVKKVRKLLPDRFLLVTSLPLSSQNKNELKKIFRPFILSANDIFGKEDLNRFLADHPEIETRYFKLWFSSINVYRRILNNAIEGRTKYELERIKAKIPFYVVTKKLDEANKKLSNKKLLLITGQPGIGKTTLAEIILFDRAKKGFQVYKVENVLEAENVISDNRREKQLFYFDDFLGSSYLEIINANRTETQLTSFVERVKNTPNKYLILTTRTIILNHAIEKYEKINHSNISSQQFEIRLNDYSQYEKALIFYNHLYFRKIPNRFFTCILKDQFYRTIIKHKNYTPRIIDFITDLTKISDFSEEQYFQFVNINLNNPKEIWRYSFTHQIGHFEKCLLLTLFTFQGQVDENSLIQAFEQRIELEKNEHNQIPNSNQFIESMRILLNGFVKLSISNIETGEKIYTFINPSLIDFLIGYIKESYQERKDILSSICFIEQIERFDPIIYGNKLESEFQKILKEKISTNKLKGIYYIKNIFAENSQNIKLMKILIRFCTDIEIDKDILKIIKKIDLSISFFNVTDNLEYLLFNIPRFPLTNMFVKKYFFKIIENYLNEIEEQKKAMNLIEIFEKFGYSYSKYVESEDGFEKISHLIINILKEEERIVKSEREEEIRKLSEVEKIYEKIEELKYDLQNSLLPNEYLDNIDYDIGMDKSYWERKIKENLSEDEISNQSTEYYKPEIFLDEDSMIDDLFSKKG